MITFSYLLTRLFDLLQNLSRGSWCFGLVGFIVNVLAFCGLNCDRCQDVWLDVRRVPLAGAGTVWVVAGLVVLRDLGY